MAELHEVKLQIKDQEPAREEKPVENMSIESVTVGNGSGIIVRNYVWWLKMAIYSICLLSGQTTLVLLGRQYFQKGGNSKWMESLLQSVGFPIIIPIYFYFASSKSDYARESPAPLTVRAPICLGLGTAFAMAAFLFTVALKYLPVSTFSLINSTPLAFTAFFAFFMNSQKFTALIINSLVLLTISSVLLIIDVDSGSSSTKVSKGKFVVGFVCAIAGSAIVGLITNLIQLSFRKVLKGNPLAVIFETQMCISAVASCIYVVGLFASGDWKKLQREKHGFALGEVSYIMNLVWTAVSWQVASVGSVGLVFEVSSVFANVISVLGLPIVPILAIFFFDEKMSGVKAIAMILSVWGFISYIYQHYLDDRSSRTVQEKDPSSGTGDNSLPQKENNDPRSGN